MLQAISGTNSGFERPNAGKSIHLRARELLPIATHRVPAVKVQTMTNTCPSRSAAFTFMPYAAFNVA